MNPTFRGVIAILIVASPLFAWTHSLQDNLGAVYDLTPEERRDFMREQFADVSSLQQPDESDEEFRIRLLRANMAENLQENAKAIEFVMSELSEEQSVHALGELMPTQLDNLHRVVKACEVELRALHENPRRIAEEYFAKMSAPPAEGITDAFIRDVAIREGARIRRKMNDALNGELLFHQMREVHAWNPRVSGVRHSLTETPIGDALGINSREQSRLNNRSAEIGIELRRALIKAQRETKELYNEILDEVQAAKFKELYYSSSLIERPFVPEEAKDILQQIPRDALKREADREGSGK